MEQEGWRQTDGIENLYRILFYSKTDLTGNDISNLVRPSFIVVFKTPLPRHRTQRRKHLLFVPSSRNAIESIIRDPRIDHPWLYTGKISVKHRDEIYVSRYFSFIRGTRHDDSLKIIERKREREGEYQVIEGQPIFECRAFFNLHNVSFREIPQSRIRLFVTRVQFL